MINGMKRKFERALKEGIPVYLAEVYESYYSKFNKDKDGARKLSHKLRFFCPVCFRFHGHGTTELMYKELTHRVAHCDNDSMSRAYINHSKGYYLFVLKENQKSKFL